MLQLVRCSDGRVVARRVDFATTWWAKTRGLLGRSFLDADEALVLVGARRVHTIGMTFPIDVVFVNENWAACRVVRHMARNRIGPKVSDSRFVIEMSAGAAHSLSPGTTLCRRCVQAESA